jgi:hypothetical protein
MPDRGFYRDIVRAALIADGWTITHDPLDFQVGEKDLRVDLGPEQLLAAKKHGRKIAVDVESFLGASEVADLEHAVGRYTLCHILLAECEPDRQMYLAVPEENYEELFTEPIGQVLLRRERLRLIVFDPEKGVIVQWVPE